MTTYTRGNHPNSHIKGLFQKGHKGFRNSGNFKKGQAPWNKGKRHEAIMGEKNPMWRGGEITRRRGHEWQLIRKQIIIKYDFKCANCGKETQLCIHHKIPYRQVGEHKIDNLIPLCRSCHTKEEWRIKNDC